MLRRDFVTGCSAAAAVLSSKLPTATAADAVPPVTDRIALFTDHLDDAGFNYAELAKMIAPLKIAGPDLTVRGGGVVPPERAAEELPKAAAAFRDEGMSIPMISTNLTAADDPTAKPILSTMGKLGIRYFKLGYYHYHDVTKWDADIETERKRLAGLLELSRAAGAMAGLHNHAGASIGGAVWDAWEMLKPLDVKDVGFYYDPGHGTLEGPKHSWKLNLQRIKSRVVMVAVKDYVWEKTDRGWQTRWCPLGEGMVNWDEFFQLLAKIPFAGPLSVHIEYNLGGSTRVERIDNALAAAQRDVAFVRKHLAKASGM
jgi:sugar phosphate isomerase/epimerase